MCDMLAYLCRAEHARNEALGPPPDCPKGEWAIEAAGAIFDVPFVQAEIVVEAPEQERPDVNEALEALGATRLTMDAVIG